MNLELLSGSAITGALTTPYWRVSVIEETTSTQTLLRESKPVAGDVIITEFQSAGRGRLDRTFEAPKSSALLFSFYIEPKISNQKYGFVPLIAGLATVTAINELTNSEKFQCKWPNDILFGDSKVAGLLAEVCGDGIILGIGINVSTIKEELPVATASSIFLATGKVINRNILAVKILEKFKELLDSYISGADLTEVYIKNCATIGRQIEATLPGNKKVLGKAIAIDDAGGLVLDSGLVITVGDLIHLNNSK